MSLFSGSEFEKKVAQSQKKKRQVVLLSDQPPKKLLEIAKKRIDAVHTPIVELFTELEQKRNSIVSEISNFEISQKDVPEADKKPAPTTVWDFVEKRCRRKEGESDGALKKRSKAIMEMMQGFIEEELFNDDKTGRIVQWFRTKGLLNLEFFESAGGMFMDNGKPAKSSQEDQWHGLLRYTTGKRILACVIATADIKELLGKIVVLSGYHDIDTDRQESYFQRLYNAVAKDLLFGALKAKKEQTESSTKKKRKADDSEDEAEVSGGKDDEDYGDDDESGDDDEDDDGDDDDDDESESEHQGSDGSSEEKKKKRRKVDEKKKVEEKKEVEEPTKIVNELTDAEHMKMFDFVGQMIVQDDDDNDNATLEEIANKTDLSKKRIRYKLWYGTDAAKRIKDAWIGYQSIDLSNQEFHQLYVVVKEIYDRECASAAKQKKIEPQEEKKVLEESVEVKQETNGDVKVEQSVPDEMKVDDKVEQTN